MTYSLNELAALAQRAARGAGFEQGTAQEAAHAVRWLAARRLNGATALLACLTCRAEAGCGPRPGTDAARTCPLRAGAAVCDTGRCDGDWPEIAVPLLMLPFLAAAAGRDGQALRLEIAGCAARVTADSLALTGDPALLLKPGAARVASFPAPSCPAPSCPAPPCSTGSGPIRSGPPDPGARAQVAQADWSALQNLAWRTYAPATTRSRLSGAGAGLKDGD